MLRGFLVASLVGLALGSVACVAPSDGEEEGDDGADVAEEALSQACSKSRDDLLAAASPARREVIRRGFTWYDARVSYSQSRSYNGYRTDCSGFISMCWDLGKSYTTAAFINGGGESDRLGDYDDLLPGDALVRRSGRSGHVVLFLGWNDRARTGACVLEQNSTRLDMEYGVRSVSSLERSRYRPIRAEKLRSDT